jgi:NAD(P)-dependent dehydrogenase (short-subunit alcohol dehydrogenase family)
LDLGLQGKVAIVTAATANIGRGIALELASEGAKVVIVGRDAEAGARVVDAAKARGAGDAVFVQADLLDKASPARIVAAAEELGPIEILVNNLGGNVDQSLFVKSDPDKWDADIDLNFGTVLRMTHAVLQGMVERKRGNIVNIGSLAGIVGDYMLPVYSAMKGAVHAFTVVLAKEVGQHNIRVNAIAPYGTFATSPDAYSKGSRFHPDQDFFTKHHDTISDFDKSMRGRRTYLSQTFGTPEDMAAVVALLVSDRAKYVTGQIWPIEGGALM